MAERKMSDYKFLARWTYIILWYTWRRASRL